MDASYSRSGRAISWLPLIVGGLASYGPVGWNYGFALYFLTWRHGFVKRALVGEMFAGFGHLTRGDLLGIEYAFLALGFALTYAVFRRVLFGSIAERTLAAVLLCAPAGLPHLGFLFAQPDITLYVLLLCAVWLFLQCNAVVATVLSLPLCLAALLGHEAFSLMFYPLVVAILVDLCRRGRLPGWLAVMHLLIMIAAFGAILHWGTLKVAPAVVLHDAQLRTTVPIQPQLYEVMASNFAQQRALVHRMYSPGVMRIVWITLALSAPYFFMLIRLLEDALRAAESPRWQRGLIPLLFLSPMLLCGLGHDVSRWIGAMCLDATLFVLYMYLSDGRDGPVRKRLIEWAEQPAALAWLAYLIAVGPYGATGIRSAEDIFRAWTGF